MEKKPRLENGFIRIATGSSENDILSALISLDLTSTEYKVLLTVIRKTWGFHKKSDWISYSQFVKFTNKSRISIWSAINKLVKSSLLVKQTEPGKRTLYSINKAGLVKKALLVKKTKLVKQTEQTSKVDLTQLVKQTEPTKDILTKETNTKEKKRYIHPLKANIDEEYLQALAERNNVPINFVKSKFDDMVLWHEQNPYKNKKISWKATLATWVKKDQLKIRERSGYANRTRGIDATNL